MKYSAQSRSRILVPIVSTCMLGLVFAAVAAKAAGRVPDADDASRLDAAWRQAIQIATHGDQAAERLASMSTDPKAAELADWLEDRAELEATREDLTRKDYEKYVSRVKKWHAKGNIARALENALLAYRNTDDREEFREADWLKALREDAAAKAEEHRESNEWLDAHAIYYELSEIYEQDGELRSRREDCLTHARLEALYEEEDTGWKESLAGIEPEMVEESLWRIDQKYVEEADFRAMTIAGLEQVLLLAESPALRELFEHLRDADRREEFVGRVRIRLSQAKAADSMTRQDAARFFAKVMKANRQTVQLPEELVAREYMDGSLEQLDEFTSVIWPVEYKEFEKHTRGNFIGVGIQIRQEYNEERECNEIVVVSPLEDTPAYKAGIQADDVIRRVDGHSLCELEVSLSKAVEMITGPEGTHVTLTIYRPSVGKEIEYELKRERVEIFSVKGTKRTAEDEQEWNHLLDPELGIGYARVVNFQENTVGELHKVISELQAEGKLRGFILDLRFNPGGLLTSAVQMAELFLARDEAIVSTRGLRSRPSMLEARRDGPFKDLPLIVLVNEYSASASEIVAGAIQDHGRGLIVGDRTYGKFSVQNLIPLVRSDAHLKLTTAHYYLPSGRSLHREEESTEWGVEPDVKVALVPKEIRKVIEIRREADVLGPRGEVDGDTAASEAAEELAEPESESQQEQVDDGRSSAETEAPSEDGGNGRPDDPPEAPTTQPAEAQEDEPEPDPNNRPAVDPQLEAALLLMRIRLLTEEFPAIAQCTREAIDPEGRPVTGSPQSATVKD